LRIDISFDLDFASAVEQTYKSAIRNPQSAIEVCFQESLTVFTG